MTEQEAIDHFWNNFKDIQDSKELTRLLYTVLPSLDTHIDLVALNLDVILNVHTDKVFEISLDANKDISVALSKLSPLFSKVLLPNNDSCHTCQRYTNIKNRPTEKAAGLKADSILLNNAHAVLDVLNKQTNIEDWWNVFIDHTSLWLQTAYGWSYPTMAQQSILDAATVAFRTLLPILSEYTIIDYVQKESKPRIKWDCSTIVNPSSDILPIDGLSQCTFLHAINAGNNIIRLRNRFDDNTNFVIIDGFNPSIAKNLYVAIAEQGDILCNLYDSSFIRKNEFNSNVLNSNSNHTLTLPDMTA